MEFQPRAPKEGINVSEEHPLKEASVLIVGLAAAFAAVAVLVIFFVDLAVPLIPAEAEARVLSSWIPDGVELQKGSEVEAVQALIARLASHWPDCPYSFRIGVFNSDDPNALALPGGLILVSTELLEGIESENELAAVLGHEIGHFQQRDHLRRFGRGAVLQILMAVTLGQSGSFTLGNHVSSLTLNNFGREQESQADSFGLSLVQAEYGHVNGSWRFFERLGAEDSRLDRLATSYLSTHPASSDRSERLRRLAVERGWSTEGPLTAWE